MQVMATIEHPPTQEIFSHLDHEGKWRIFLVGTMQLFAARYAGCADIVCVNAPIEPDYVEYVRRNGGIEQERLDRLAEPYLSKPCIGIYWPDESVTIIDGNHRMIKRHELGHTEISFYIFKCPFWEKFIMDEEQTNWFLKRGNPLEIPSGMLDFEKRQIVN